MLLFEEAAVEIFEGKQSFAPSTLASASSCCFPGQKRFDCVAPEARFLPPAVFVEPKIDSAASEF